MNLLNIVNCKKCLINLRVLLKFNFPYYFRFWVESFIIFS